MEQLKHLEETIQLGKRLVAEFSESSRSSITTKWMAHYLAELIVNAENESDAVLKKKLQEECCDFIIKLWKQKEELPFNSIPLSNIQEVLSIMDALIDESPEVPSWQEWRKFENKNPWGKFINSIRMTADSIFGITLCLGLTREKLLKEKEWLEFPNMLTDGENLVISKLDDLINDHYKQFNIVYVSAKEEENTPTDPKLRLRKATDKMQKLLDKQQKALDAFKKFVHDPDGGTGDDDFRSIFEDYLEDQSDDQSFTGNL